VWIASALTRPEFLQFSARMGKNKTAVAGNKLSEFARTISEIRRRNLAGLITFGFAAAKTSIYRIDSNASGHGLPVEMIALSPSHGDILSFLQRIESSMPRGRQTKIAVPSPQPNDVSIATMISIGPFSVLLGADLENGSDPTGGWKAVL